MDFDSDELDGHLFRFWIRGCAQFTGEVAKTLAQCVRPAEYRKALIELARSKGVNFPLPPALPQSRSGEGE